MKTYKIGDVARLLGSTTQALRFYEQEGVIVPQKTENGTRIYTESDIIRLLAFKRFQLLDFSVQNVADHFKHGNLDSLLTRMTETSVRLKQESEQLQRRAQAIDRFEWILRLAQKSIGEMCLVTRPALYLHPCALAELDRLESRQHETFVQFMNAMPDAHICFLYNSQQPTRAKFHFTITENSAHGWQLPLEDMLRFASGQSVRLFVRTDARLWQADYLNEQIALVAQAGHQVDDSLPVIVQQLASEQIGKQGYLLAAIYVPIIAK
jgi:DNA-binding transcriptional MerR regulator